ncbi:hypothetical protein BG003_010127 [Podila horticola]|nr:hypothetical protein BG003_010127 [Podila horticola]
MQITKAFVTVAIVISAIAFVAEASPIPKAVEAYVPPSERLAAEEAGEHHLLKRAVPGANDWNCKPTAIHPRPLILVHGIIGNETNNWMYLGPRFVKAGYCVYALTYGQMPGVADLGGLDSMVVSAGQLSTFVDKVLAATNTTKVDLLGHSQGTMMPRYYLKYLGGAKKVAKFGGFGAVVYGTTLLGLVPLIQNLGLWNPVTKILDPICKACLELVAGSSFIQDLNKGGDTVPGVEYSFIVSRTDEIITPYTSGIIRDKNPLAKTTILQDICPLDLAEHIAVMMDPIVFHKMDAFFTPTANQLVTCLDGFDR